MRGFKRFKREVESYTFGPLAQIHCSLEPGGRTIDICFEVNTIDSRTGKPFTTQFHYWLRRIWPPNEVRQIIENLWTLAWEHEKREFMRKKGRRVYRPH